MECASATRAAARGRATRSRSSTCAAATAAATATSPAPGRPRTRPSRRLGALRDLPRRLDRHRQAPEPRAEQATTAALPQHLLVTPAGFDHTGSPAAASRATTAPPPAQAARPPAELEQLRGMPQHPHLGRRRLRSHGDHLGMRELPQRTTATGKPNDHPPSSDACETCHTTRTWAGAAFDQRGYVGLRELPQRDDGLGQAGAAHPELERLRDVPHDADWSGATSTTAWSRRAA